MKRAGKLAAVLTLAAVFAELLLKWRLKERLEIDPVEQTAAVYGEHGAFSWGNNLTLVQRLMKGILLS